MRKTFLALFCATAWPLLLTAQNSDPHFQTPSIATIVQHSTFLHGYLHGYEEGFHQADINLQMGRVARDESVRHDAPVGYRKLFGPHAMYDAGFHEGFNVGYADGSGGHRFRGLQNVLAAAAQDPIFTGEIKAVALDSGVRTGYVAGQHQGLTDGRRGLQAQPSPACPVRSGNLQHDFCAAYAAGYNLGYSDGFENQTRTTLAEAGR